MKTPENKGVIYEFGHFVLYPSERILFSNGQPLHLPAKEFDTLVELVRNNGHAVSKDELMAVVWPDSFVEEGNLKKQISRLRKVLNTNGHDYIETVPKHGYRFLAELRRVESVTDENIIQKRTVSRVKLVYHDDGPNASLALHPAKSGGNRAALIGTVFFLVTLIGAGLYFWLGLRHITTGGLVNLTNNLAEDSYPQFSPDGKKIAFASNRNGPSHIFVMNSDGSNTEELTSSEASDSTPIWSPTGAQIVFQRILDRNMEIFTMNADGSGQKRLTFNPTADAGPPQFSPDGAHIVFARAASGEGKAQYNFDIFTMSTDGGDVRQLTTDGEFDAGPFFSPDGSTILFVSGREGNFDVFAMNSDGSGQTNLTKSPDLNEVPFGWTTDGKQILFNRNSPSSADIFQIWIMNADGSNPRQISSFTEKVSGTTYSPAAGSFIFFCNKNGNQDIYKMNAGNLPPN